MSERSINDPYNVIQGLIGEYESKTDKPTIEGFSMFLERRKQYALSEYREYEKVKMRRQNE